MTVTAVVFRHEIEAHRVAPQLRPRPTTRGTSSKDLTAGETQRPRG